MKIDGRNIMGWTQHLVEREDNEIKLMRRDFLFCAICHLLRH